MNRSANTALAIIMAAGFALVTAEAQTTPRASQPEPFSTLPADAQTPFGGLSLTPTRLVLSPQAPAGQVTLYNSGSAPLSYRIELVDLDTLPAGGYAERTAGVETPQWSAINDIRYSPRQVTLQPGQRQVVRLMARVARDGEPQERRSHLRFSSIPLVAPAESSPTPAPQGNTINVSAKLEYRITIPLIVRSGAGVGGSALEALRVMTDAQSGKKALLVTLRRTGSFADHGAIRAYNAAGREVGVLRGISVLPPLSTRDVRFEVTGAPARVVFSSEERGGPQFAEARVN